MENIEIRHDLQDLTVPVGFLGPDGRWFLIDSSENGLAHIYLAEHVFDAYADYIEQKRIFVFHIDRDLEHAGIIKLHGDMVRYYAKCAYGGYYDQGLCETPEVSDIQIERLCEYAMKYGDNGKLSINKTYPSYSYTQLRQMDRIQRNEAFKLK